MTMNCTWYIEECKLYIPIKNTHYIYPTVMLVQGRFYKFNQLSMK